ncbi:hypothetical protein ILUMI_24633 [Ignelater luminosus]|uniref:Uncharacterized protein n=1 Tax=Ignelater luminosus TaxID=2038154 RepID=A0A8K0C6R6_IGNLU|nr:hypothetical protein ILUMI_24633 [Ignelater luminosus]
MQASKHGEAVRRDSQKWRKLRRKFLTGNTFINISLPVNDGYYTSNKDNAPDNIKSKPKARSEQKISVWVVILAKSISEPVIRPSTGPAISVQLYQRECLSIADKFIKTHHKDRNYVFWPYLASSRYAATTQYWLKEKNVKLVTKEANGQNIPKPRPIEDFC